MVLAAISLNFPKGQKKHLLCCSECTQTGYRLSRASQQMHSNNKMYVGNNKEECRKRGEESEQEGVEANERREGEAVRKNIRVDYLMCQAQRLE